MRSEKDVGRIVGIALVLQLSGFIVPFIFLLSLASPNYLADAAGSSSQIKLAVFWLYANCALTIGISVLLFPVLQRFSLRGALVLLSAGIVMFALQAIDNVHLMSMLSISDQYVQGGVPGDWSQAAGELARWTRKWAHYAELVAIDVWVAVLYMLLVRFQLVPRLVAVFGLLTVLVHFAAAPLPLILGYGTAPMLAPAMGLGHLLLAGWLIAKGLGEGNRKESEG